MDKDRFIIKPLQYDTANSSIFDITTQSEVCRLTTILAEQEDEVHKIVKELNDLNVENKWLRKRVPTCKECQCYAINIGYCTMYDMYCLSNEVVPQCEDYDSLKEYNLYNENKDLKTINELYRIDFNNQERHIKILQDLCDKQQEEIMEYKTTINKRVYELEEENRKLKGENR